MTTTDERAAETSPSNSVTCSTAIDYDRMRMARQREILQLSEDAMNQAIAMFPVSVASMAADLGRLLRLKQQGQRNCDAAIAMMADRIKKEYRNFFGTEMGQ